MLASSVATVAADLASAKPERVGVSSQRLARIDDLARGYITERKYAGVVTMIARDGRVIHSASAGQFGIDDATPVAEDTLFRIYSMTKPITAVAAMMLYEQGKFQMTDPVANFLPELGGLKLMHGAELVDPASQMTMRQLLTHTAGLTYGATPDNPVDLAYGQAKLLESRDLDDFISRLAPLPLRFEPGTRYHYSVSYDVLGAVIERISGQPLDRFFETNIFAPLGMQDTFFAVPEQKLHRLASNHIWDREKGELVLVRPARDPEAAKVTFFSGGGGLISTVSDYMRFCQMLLNGGSYNGTRLISPKTVQWMTSNHLSETVRAEGRGQYPSDDLYPGQSMGLGFGVVTNPALMPSVSSLGEYSWGGAAGTKFWIDPEENIIGIAMVQLFRAPWQLRYDLKVATYQALTTLNER